MRKILVIRFGSLGDLCILGWALARLAGGTGSSKHEVTLVTKAAFAPLMERVRGVDRVIRLGGSGPADVARLAAVLRGEEWDIVIDAHNILRGHLLLGLMRRRPDRRLAKDTSARLSFMALGRTDDRLRRTMLDRFEDLTRGLGRRSTSDGGSISPPLGGLRPEGQVDHAAPVGIAPGAQWDTKRWPPEFFAELLEKHLQESRRSVRIFLGPRETAWYDRSALGAAAAASDRVEVIRDRSLIDVAALLAGCRLLVTNDSGLLHVSEAVGTPVMAFFGPTVKEFGYFPLLPASRVLEKPLDCRPCSRNGKRPCHRGDLACLMEIGPAEAHAHLRSILDTVS